MNKSWNGKGDNMKRFFQKKLSIYFFIFLFCSFLSVIQAGNSLKTVVIIGEIVKEFDEQTPCDFQYWANKLENSCKCCLIKRAPELFSNKSNATDIVNECLTSKKQCDVTIINQLIKNDVIKLDDEEKEEAYQKLITLLYNSSVIVKEVSSKDIMFDLKGEFQEASISLFLERAFKAGVLTNPDFKSAQCVQAKDIIGEKGYQTKQLFEIISTCSGTNKEYILKEIASQTAEILRLNQSIMVPDLASYIYPNYVPGFPVFIMPNAYLAYRYKDKEHYLALMPKSKGIKLSSLIEKFYNKQIGLDEVLRIFFDVGQAFAAFHKKFMHKYQSYAQQGSILNPTLVHGDAHQANIFFDPKDRQVIMIDNERIKDYSPKKPAWEIKYFFFTTLNLFTPVLIKQDQTFINQWLLLTMRSFIQGYASVYPEHQRAQVFKELYQDMQDLHLVRYAKVIEDVFKGLI